LVSLRAFSHCFPTNLKAPFLFMKILFKMQGGSHSYGLNTPASDTDWRGIYAHTEIADIVGLQSGVNDSKVKQNETTDEAYWEVCRFFNLLKDGNTQAVEILFAKSHVIATPEFHLIRAHRRMLLDTEKMFKVLQGYAQSERRLANGERTGKLGGKRKEAIDTYGYSPKNFVQLFRLLWAGTVFFSQGYFPLNVGEYNQLLQAKLLTIKTNPKTFSVDYLNKYADVMESMLIEEFEKRDKSKDFKFDEKAANHLCYLIYAPLIRQAGKNMGYK
jgi:predicted nucleotidyltransferase